MKTVQKHAHSGLLALCLGSAMAALLAGPAAADEWSGILSGGFNSASGNGFDLTAVGVTLGLAVPLSDSGFKAQADATYDIASGTANSQVFSWDGLVYYRDPQWQLGGFVENSAANNHGGQVTSYGAVGDYYFSDQFSAGIIGGGFTSSGVSGGIVEGHLIGYVMPTLSLKGFDTYVSASGSSTNMVGAIAEWQISDTAPLSFYAGYSNLQISGIGPSSNFDVFSVGVKIYLNGSGPLVNLQRSGNVDLSTLISSVRYAF